MGKHQAKSHRFKVRSGALGNPQDPEQRQMKVHQQMGTIGTTNLNGNRGRSEYKNLVK